MRRRVIVPKLVLIFGHLGGQFLGVAGGDWGPGEGRVAERIVLFRLMRDGLDGKRVSEIAVQEPAKGGDPIIVIRYEE